MLEQARINNVDLFGQMHDIDDQQLVMKYSMFLSSLLDCRYEWFHKDLVSLNQLDALLINEEDFETMISYFRTACIKNNIAKAKVVNFLEFLTSHKDAICKIPLNKKSFLSGSQPQMSISDSLEQQKKFDMFIERFFKAIA